MIRALGSIYTLLIHTVPFGLALSPVMMVQSTGWRVALLFAAPMIYAISFLLICGLLSLPFRGAIQEGRFPRDLNHPIYGRRRLHATCWTSVYYSFCYPIFLSVPVFKRVMFRLFGYRGDLDFTVYPDTWIRDLPILRIKSGAYVANKATLGTNMPLKNGQILVEGIEIGVGTLIGHLTMIAPGTQLGDGCEIHEGVACGVRVTIGTSSLVGTHTAIGHTVKIGENVEIRGFSCIGHGARIGSGIKVPIGSLIPPRARIQSQEDVQRYISSETKDLYLLREQLSRILAQRLQEEN